MPTHLDALADRDWNGPAEAVMRWPPGYGKHGGNRIVRKPGRPLGKAWKRKHPGGLATGVLVTP